MNTHPWEERWHPLREEWIIVAAHRQHRPWSGETLAEAEEVIPPYLPNCYLCPGNRRVSGITNPDYAGVHVFDNDHPCVGQDAPLDLPKPGGLYKNRPAQGLSRVVCYSPLHNVTLADLPTQQIDALLAAWQEQYRELGAMQGVNHVLIFENKGEAVGVSNPHPHCQIYATNFVFKTIENEARICRDYLAGTGRILFQDILAAEHEFGGRIIAENATAIAFLPYFARYAYEVYVAPKATHASLAALSEEERWGLASVLREVLIRYDNLWQTSFPYVMALHQAPTDGGDYGAFHFHIELHPPLRKLKLLKYLAGPEIGGGNFVSDTAPEQKALELAGVSGDALYRDRSSGG